MVTDLTTQQGSLAGAPSFDISPPAGTPNVDGQSKDQIAELLRESNAGGTPQAAPVAPPAVAPEPGKDPLNQLPEPQEPAPAEPGAKPPDPDKPDFTNIFNKFGIPAELQGNESVLKMAGSYAEAEKSLSQNFQAKSQSEKLTAENEQLLTMAEGFQKQINDMNQAPAQSQASDSSAPMTEKEIEEYNSNPKAVINRAVQDALKPIQQKAGDQQKQNEVDKVMDFKVLNAINTMKSDTKFKGLEANADEILKQGYLNYDPRSVNLAFHAARSIAMPKIMAEAQNEAFSKGYKKAMDEIKRGVDGGKSTVPAEGSAGLGGFTEDQLNDMSAGDMAKLLPNSGV